MFRVYCILISVCVPCVSIAGPTDTRGPTPPVAVQRQLNLILERMLRNEALPNVEWVNERTSINGDWYDDLSTWLSVQSRSDTFDRSQHTAAAQKLGLLALRTYRIKGEQKTRTIAPFSELRHPVLRPLPGVDLDDSVVFSLNIGAHPTNRHLAVTTQSPHTVHLNGSPVRPVLQSPYDCLDNHGYTPVSYTHLTLPTICSV